MDEYDRWYRSYERRRRFTILAGYAVELVVLFLVSFLAGMVFAWAWLG